MELDSANFACLEAVQHQLGLRSGFDLASADVYSIGVTLYLLLTGEFPLPAPDGEEEEEDDEDVDYDNIDFDAEERRILVDYALSMVQAVRLLGTVPLALYPVRMNA